MHPRVPGPGCPPCANGTGAAPGTGDMRRRHHVGSVFFPRCSRGSWRAGARELRDGDAARALCRRDDRRHPRVFDVGRRAPRVHRAGHREGCREGRGTSSPSTSKAGAHMLSTKVPEEGDPNCAIGRRAAGLLAREDHRGDQNALASFFSEAPAIASRASADAARAGKARSARGAREGDRRRARRGTSTRPRTSVEQRGIEPLTSALRTRRSPS
jgi:hypothetical protein